MQRRHTKSTFSCILQREKRSDSKTLGMAVFGAIMRMRRRETLSTPSVSEIPTDTHIPFWHQLRWNLVFFFVSLAIIPALIVMGIGLSHMSTHAQQQVFNQLESVAKLKSNQITRWLDESQTTLNLLLNNTFANTNMHTFLTDQSPNEHTQQILNAFLSRAVESQTRYTAFFLYNTNGVILAASDKTMIGKVVSQQPYFADSLLQTYIQPPYYSPSSTQLTMFITRQVINTDGNTVGVLAGQLDLTILSDIMIERSGLGQSGDTYLVSAQNNYFLTPSRLEDTPRMQAYHSEGIDRALTGENGSDTFMNYRDPPVRVLGVYRWMPQLQAALLAEVNVSEALSTYSKIRNLSIVLTAITTLIAVIVGLYSAARIANPISKLTYVATHITNGDLSQRVTIDKKNEIGVLAQAFNTMANNLQHNLAGLEHMVAQRTSELEEALDSAIATRAELERTLSEREALITELSEARITAEQANTMKSKFLANMSHELRTPLNSIINFTRIISAGMRGPVTEEQLDYLNRVYASGEHLLGLINDILDLSKIEAGRMELYKERCQIGELIQSTMSTAIGLTKGKTIVLHQDIAPDLPLVEADRTRIRQVLLNILSNAAKFTDEGSITVRVRHENTEIIVSVTDTGSGIPEDKLSTIFEEFTQADGGSEKSYQGTGLGLAICRKLIEMHGGRIWVESTIGVGSTFSFSLPMLGIHPLDTLLILKTPTTKGPNVLVVDDDEAAVDTIATYLQPDDYRVYCVTDSQHVLHAARQLQPTAIIVDVTMPHKDGWAMLSELQTAPDLYNVPVMLYAMAMDDDDTSYAGLLLNANAYLIKPINEQQLRATVRRFVADHASVVVIDDDPDTLEHIAQELTTTYHVITATSGHAGLICIAENRPDLIILDLIMPDIDGFAVLEHLEQQQADAHGIPVIALTGKVLTTEERTYLNQRIREHFYTRGMLAPEQFLSNMKAFLTTTHSSR